MQTQICKKFNVARQLSIGDKSDHFFLVLVSAHSGVEVFMKLHMNFQNIFCIVNSFLNLSLLELPNHDRICKPKN